MYRIKNDKRNKMENIYYLMLSAPFFMCVTSFVLQGTKSHLITIKSYTRVVFMFGGGKTDFRM